MTKVKEYILFLSCVLTMAAVMSALMVAYITIMVLLGLGTAGVEYEDIYEEIRIENMIM